MNEDFFLYECKLISPSTSDPVLQFIGSNKQRINFQEWNLNKIKNQDWLSITEAMNTLYMKVFSLV